MLIAFIALVAMIDAGLQWVEAWARHLLEPRGIFVPSMSLQSIFGTVFSPAAYLIGTPVEDVTKVGNLLGQKLVLNEFVAYVTLTKDYAGKISARTLKLATFALTGFANFASIGIQIGGIGQMAPTRRGDLAKLGITAVFAGSLATLINAAIAGVLLPPE
jgi:CNT family concentrative nucleoside transporter